MRLSRALALVAAVVVCALVLPPSAWGQAIVTGATKVQVSAHPQHNDTFAGAPVVASYNLVVKKQADGSLVVRVPSGKPTPDAANLLTFSLPNNLPKNTVMVAAVEAVNSAGVAVTPDSGPFGDPAAPAPWSAVPTVKP